MTFSPFPLLLVVLLAAGGAWFSFDQVLLQRDSARSERDQALKDLDAIIRVANATAERLATAAANDTKHTQELANALKHNQALRDSVRAGDQRLFVHASCPASADVRTDTAAGGVADAGPAELAADARSDYFTLRDQLALSKQMILGLQDHIRSFCTTPLTINGATPQ